MFLNALKKRMGSPPVESSAPFVLPSVVLEFQPGFVLGARLDRSSRQVKTMEVRPVDVGALVPTPSRPNMANEAAIRSAINQIVTKVGNGSGKLGLLLPDPCVRVGTFAFESLPSGRHEAEALVRWRMRSILPYPPEEGRVSYQVIGKEANSLELLALAVRRSVLAEYEAALTSVNGGPCLVLPATVALLPLLPEPSEGGQLLIHVCAGSVTTVVVAGNRVRFWRNRGIGSVPPEEVWREVGEEVGRVLANCSDNLKLEVRQLFVCLRPAAAEDDLARLKATLGREVSLLEAGSAHAGNLAEPERELFKRYGITAAGLMANVGRER